ncbi:MAG: hypothetical protein AMJ69_06320 [Gammaproteobacteria bacterium SG8_47]|nr:MAG: hypothetical protein AMJ69_06320 [Gammaproteobacteria bacterium SG8_47]
MPDILHRRDETNFDALDTGVRVDVDALNDATTDRAGVQLLRHGEIEHRHRNCQQAARGGQLSDR